MIKNIATNVLPHVKKLTMIMTGTDEAVVLTMISDKKDDGIQVSPINIKGSAEEVEAELANAIKKIFEANAGVYSNVDAVAEEVKEAATKPGKSKTVKKATTKSATTEKTDTEEENIEEDEKEEPVKLTADQVKVQKLQKKNFERAEKATDVDVINFVEKEIVKAYEAAKMPQTIMDEVTSKFEALRIARGDTSGKPVETAPASDGLFAKPAETAPAAAPAIEKKEEAAPAATAKPAAEEKEIIF